MNLKRNLFQTCVLCAALLQAVTSKAQTVTKIATGGHHCLFLKSDGSLWAMGWNDYGQLGDGTTNNAVRPEQIVGGGVTTIAAGFWHSLFLKSDGSLWAMGLDQNGQLGDGTSGLNLYRNQPEQIVGGGVTAIAAGYNCSLFLKSDGSLWAMGNNADGALGDGTTTVRDTPEQIVAGGVTAIAAGGDHCNLFLESDGSLWGMGYNGYGQLGDGTTIDQHTPEQIEAGGVTAIAAGWNFSLFLESDGSLWGMGGSGGGELGDSTTNNAVWPEQIVTGGVTAIAAGGNDSLLLKSDGSLWGMGGNLCGELGDGTTTERDTPEQIVASNVTAIAEGWNLSVFLESDGSLWGMGDNGYGSLGDGTTNNAVRPEMIVGPSSAVITVQANPAGAGTVDGGGTFPVGSQQTISAEANDGWTFALWSDLNSASSRTITVPAGGATYIANFGKTNEISNIWVQANPTNGGTVCCSGGYPEGALVQISATANTGWTFTSWDDGSTNNPYIISVPEDDGTFTASFLQPPAVITVLANPTNGGTVSGAGTYPVGTNVQISATANSGWTFTGWSDGNSSNPRAIIVLAGGATYTANFSQQTAVITVLANPTNGGTVTGAGTYPVGANVQISAMANSGWKFTGWNGGSTNNPYTITVPAGGATYTANFSQQTAVITVQANPTNGGTVTGAGTYPVGTNVQISATANSGWKFGNWSDGNSSNPRTITVPVSGATYIANFSQQPAMIAVLANPSGGGTVSGAGTYPVGTNVQISATANSGWTFTDWSDDNSSSPRTITVPVGGATYIANFTQYPGQTANITVQASPGNGGTVSGGGTYSIGARQQIAATANSGWTFTGWNGGSTNNPYTITVPAGGAAYTASFTNSTTDSVGDGIPDWWRAQYFGGSGTNTNSVSCAACDADATGQNNFFKYVAGLNPTNPASVFVLLIQNVTGQPNQKSLLFNPVAGGRTYTLQFRTDMATGSWAALTGFGGATTNVNNQVTVTDLSATQSQKFYRIDISLP